MGDFEAKLDSILNNPQAMSQIMSLAQSLSGNNPSPEQTEPSIAAPPPVGQPDLPLDAHLIGIIGTLFNQYNSNDDQRIALLNSLKPFVKERRYAKLDQAIQIAKLSRMARIALTLLRSKEVSDV